MPALKEVLARLFKELGRAPARTTAGGSEEAGLADESTSKQGSRLDKQADPQGPRISEEESRERRAPAERRKKSRNAAAICRQVEVA